MRRSRRRVVQYRERSRSSRVGWTTTIKAGDEIDEKIEHARWSTGRPLTSFEAIDATISNDETPAPERPGGFAGETAVTALRNSIAQRIRERTYLIWLLSGRVDGKDKKHWYAAGAELLAEIGAFDVASARCHSAFGRSMIAGDRQ